MESSGNNSDDGYRGVNQNNGGGQFMQQIIINNNISVNSARNKDESYSNKNKNPSLKGLPKEKQEMKKSAFSKNPSVKAPANQQKFR
jgi:hypothetical protein